MVSHQGVPPWQEKNGTWARKVNLKSRKDVGRRSNLLEKDSRPKSVGKIFKKLANRCAHLERSKSKQAAQLSSMRSKIERLEDILATLQSPSQGSAVDSPSKRKVELITNAKDHCENSEETGIRDFLDTVAPSWMTSANPYLVRDMSFS